MRLSPPLPAATAAVLSPPYCRCHLAAPAAAAKLPPSLQRRHAATAKLPRPPPSCCCPAAIAVAVVLPLQPSCCCCRHHCADPAPQRFRRHQRQATVTATMLNVVGGGHFNVWGEKGRERPRRSKYVAPPPLWLKIQ